MLIQLISPSPCTCRAYRQVMQQDAPQPDILLPTPLIPEDTGGFVSCSNTCLHLISVHSVCLQSKEKESLANELRQCLRQLNLFLLPLAKYHNPWRQSPNVKAVFFQGTTSLACPRGSNQAPKQSVTGTTRIHEEAAEFSEVL